MNFLQKKIPVTYLKVTEATQNKGIETYFDTEKIKAINPVYKEQLLSVFVSAIRIISDGSLAVVRIEEKEQEPKNEPEKSN